MNTTTRINLTKLSLLLLTLASGCAVFRLLRWLDASFRFVARFGPKFDALSAALSSFAFTMIGFLATIVSVLFGLAARATIQRYAKQGHLSELLFFCLLTVLCHVGTFVAAIALLSDPRWAIYALSGATLNLLQLATIALIGYNLCNRAFREEATR